MEDGCRFRLHASPDRSPYLYVREIVDGERLRQFSLAPLEWVAREDVISAYERCLVNRFGGTPHFIKKNPTTARSARTDPWR